MPELFTVKIIPTDDDPAGNLADAELHFTDDAGPLAGLKLVGFAVWERRQTSRTAGPARNVTFPARQYSVNGELRSFALLRPATDTSQQEAMRAIILAAYERQETPAAPLQPDTDAPDDPGSRPNYGPISPRRRSDDDDAHDADETTF
jgi:hypothetical protein